MYIYIYIYLEPVCSPFWWIDMDFASPTFQVPKIRYLCKKPCFFDFGVFFDGIIKIRPFVKIRYF